jgi:hypothetical protein
MRRVIIFYLIDIFKIKKGMNNLANKNIKEKKYIEAAQCLIYILGNSFYYLKLKENQNLKDMNFSKILNISPTLKNEDFNNINDLFKNDKKGPIFESNYFTENGFINLLNDIISLLNKAGIHFKY